MPTPPPDSRTLTEPPPPKVGAGRRLGPWRLLRQLSAGEDGVAYAAVYDEDASSIDENVAMPEEGEAVVDEERKAAHREAQVFDLSRLKKDAEAWQLACLSLAQRRLIDDDALLPLLGLDLDAVRPWLAVPRAERSLGDSLPLASADALHTAATLCRTLASMHRVGLHLGDCTPERILMAPGGGVWLDAIGLRVRQPRVTELTEACVPAWAEPVSSARDIYGLATLLCALSTGVEPEGDVVGPLAAAPLGAALAQGRAVAPDDRPTATELATAIEVLLEEGATLEALPSRSSATPLSSPNRSVTKVGDVGSDFGEVGRAIENAGRHQLLGVLGEGSMGAVYRARDMATGEEVALKVLNARSRDRGERARRRFMKEARLLSELRNPFIANLLEVNFEGELDWMAMELVQGRDLHTVLEDHGPLSENAALQVLADTAKGLADAHRQGIVHRDIKPANILLTDEGLLTGNPGSGTKACVLDFGIARHVEESASLAMTREGGIVGTPMYLAPEQAGMGEVGPHSDVYALGCTAFHLLVGRPPFVGKGAMVLIGMHLNAPPPLVAEERPEIRAEVSELVDRMLAKRASERFVDASAVLAEIEVLLGLSPAGDLAQHPLGVDAQQAGVRSYTFEWDLASPPAALWPYVSDTERLNRAWGLSKVEVEHRAVGDDVVQYVKTSVNGLALAWREHPFEWVENRRFGVLREFSLGPFRWLRSTVDLTAKKGGGTHLVHRFDIMPRGMLGKAAAALEIKYRGRRGLDRIYRRVDELLRNQNTAQDAFEDSPSLSASAEKRLDRGERALIKLGCNPQSVERLGEFLRHGGTLDVSHLRPLAFARRFALDADACVDTCLQAVTQGLLTLHWDLLCPICRVASEIKDTLAALKSHGHCAACNLDYELDLAGGVELIFRVHASIRKPDVATYCASSPGHSPHIRARIRVDAGERVRLELALAEGRYVLTGRGLPFELPFRVQEGGGAQRWDLDLAAAVPGALSRTLRPGFQEMFLLNGGEESRLIRVESAPDHEEAFTAARASAHATFRRLFPEQRLADGQLISIRFCSLCIVEVADSQALWASQQEEQIYGVLSGLFTALDAHFSEHGGALVKIRQDGALGVFLDPAAAVAAALSVTKSVREAGVDPSVSLRASVHQGPARAVTLNGRLDYFGSTPRGVEALVSMAGAGELVISQSVATDPLASRLVEGEQTEIVGVPTGGLGLRVPLTR